MAWTTFSLPHLAYHVTHLGTFPAADAVAQTGSLVLLTLVPLADIYALRGTRDALGAGARSARSGLPFRARTGSDQRDLQPGHTNHPRTHHQTDGLLSPPSTIVAGAPWARETRKGSLLPLHNKR